MLITNKNLFLMVEQKNKLENLIQKQQNILPDEETKEINEVYIKQWKNKIKDIKNDIIMSLGGF